MALIKSLRGISPSWGKDCYFSENASIIGDVQMGDGCSVWFNAVIRGDVHYIKIGDRVNIQDGVIIHCTYKKSPVNIGDNVSIGHGAIIHGCTIKDDVLIGMGAIVMDDVIVEKNSVIAAGAVVAKNTIVQSGSVYAGIPAKKIKDVDTKILEGEIHRIAGNYKKYAGWYKE